MATTITPTDLRSHMRETLEQVKQGEDVTIKSRDGKDMVITLKKETGKRKPRLMGALKAQAPEGGRPFTVTMPTAAEEAARRFRQREAEGWSE